MLMYAFTFMLFCFHSWVLNLTPWNYFFISSVFNCFWSEVFF